MNAEYTGNLIAEKRRALGLTQRQLADRLHVTDKAVSKWERGINFPDLGLMENLAAALDTTPAVLLGLEDADRDAVVRDMAQFHQAQLEAAQKQLRLAGWLSLLTAGLVWIVYASIAQDRGQAYQVASWTIFGLICFGFHLLLSHGAIRAWDGPDMLIALGGLFPVMLYMMGYWVTDHGFPDGVNLACILIATVFGQWLFYRTMNPQWAKAFPIIGLVAYNLWYLSRGSINTMTLLCLGVCFAAWLVLRRLDKGRRPIPVGKLIAGCALGLILFGFLNYNALVKAYVHLRQDHLIAYCEELLTSGDGSTTYGLWDVHIYPEDGMVEFHTGGGGMGPETSYEGFYYSANDAHIPFQGADLPMDIYEGTGYWTDGTDNHGTTQRFWKCFYWFEAHF